MIKQITDLTSALIAHSYVDEQNFPSIRTHRDHLVEIGLSSGLDLSVSLKDIAYKDIYHALEHEGAFNFRLMDGGLVQMFYMFQNGVLISHRLAYFPSPMLEAYQNEPEIYEDDEIYADILAKNVVAFPIRFDFSSDEKLFTAIHHPKSHLTLGQYKNCRIPVSAPLTPVVFVQFILRNLYSTAARVAGDLGIRATAFEPDIHESEQRIPHLRLA